MVKQSNKQIFKSKLVLIGIIVLIISIASLIAILGLSNFNNSHNSQNSEGTNIEQLTLYFVNTNHPDYRLDCGAVLPVQRTTTRMTQTTPDQALRILLAGTTKEEETKGFTSEFFQPGSWTFEDIKPLSAYYQKVTVHQGTATVDFDIAALSYLNAAICIQQSVKNPIYHTLTQFPEIDNVQFSFDGKVMTEWDA